MRSAIAMAILTWAGAARADAFLEARIAEAELRVTPAVTELRGEAAHTELRYRGQSVWHAIMLGDVAMLERDGRRAVMPRFLGYGVRVERPGWELWLSAHLFAVWDDSVRYVMPSLGARLGAFAVEVRPSGLFAAALALHRAPAPGRSLARDLEVDASWRSGHLELRGRYRDAVTDAGHLRDAFAGFGAAFTAHGGRAFVGAGVRRALTVDPGALPREAMTPPTAPAPSPWEALVWLELSVGVSR